MGGLSNLWGIPWDQEKINQEMIFRWSHYSNNSPYSVGRAHEIYARVSYGFNVSVTSIFPDNITRSGGQVIFVQGFNFVPFQGLKKL